MVSKKVRNIFIGVGTILITLGLTIGIYNYTRPFNMYERALKKTLNESKSHIKNKLVSSGGLEELTSQSIEYSIDKDSKTIEVKKNSLGKDETTEMLISNDKLYLKSGDNYVNIMDSDYMKELTNSLNMSGNDFYDKYQSELINSIDKNNIKKEQVTKKVEDQDENLTMLTFTVSKEKAQDIIGEYIKNNFSNNSEKLIDETINTQVELAKASNLTFTDDELKTLKENMTQSLNESLDEKLKTIEYSDITILVGIDATGHIKYREEQYDLSINGTGNSIKNITEYLEFGNDVHVTKANDINVVSMEDYLANKKEVQKKELKNFALKNPDEELSLSNVSEDKAKVSSTVDSSNKDSNDNK